MRKPVSFIIVGSGWRSLFFARIAGKYPEQFCLKYMLCRTQEKAQKMQQEYGIPTTTSAELCEQEKPDFVVIAVSRNQLLAETKKWSRKGYPVLCETPAVTSLEELNALRQLVQEGAKIQIAEQYHRYPIMAAGLKAVADGRLDEPYAVHLSVAHDYHGISLIRRMLAPKNPAGLRLKSLLAEQYRFPVRETDSRYGAITDGSINEKVRTVITMEFADGKVAFYDFGGVQYHSFIRSRHVNVQGRDGEWNDTMLRYIGEDYLPVAENLTAWLDPKYAPLVTDELLRQSKNWNPSLVLDSEQDEYAIATMMYDMAEYAEGGKEVYPMEEVFLDIEWYFLIQEAVKSPGSKILL